MCLRDLLSLLMSICDYILQVFSSLGLVLQCSKFIEEILKAKQKSNSNNNSRNIQKTLLNWSFRFVYGNTTNLEQSFVIMILVESSSFKSNLGLILTA